MPHERKEADDLLTNFVAKIWNFGKKVVYLRSESKDSGNRYSRMPAPDKSSLQRSFHVAKQSFPAVKRWFRDVKR